MHGAQNLHSIGAYWGVVLTMTTMTTMTTSVSALSDAYRADAAELAKFLDQLCLTLQQGKELQKRFAEAVDRLDAHKAQTAPKSEAKGVEQKNGARVNGGAADITETPLKVDVRVDAADTTDATTTPVTAMPVLDSSEELPPPPPPSKAPPPGLRTPVKARPEVKAMPPKPEGEKKRGNSSDFQSCASYHQQ